MQPFSFVLGNTEFTFFENVGSYTVAESVTPPHIHAMPELFIALKGEAVISGDFGKRQITGRNACLIPPQLYHDVACVSSYNRIALLFVFRKTSSGTDILDIYSAFCELLLRREPFIAEYDPTFLESIFRCLNDAPALRYEKNKHIISLIFLEMIHRSNTDKVYDKAIFIKKNGYYETVNAFDAEFQKCLSQDKSFRKLCDALFMSERQVLRIVTAEYGKNIVELRSEMRMRRAVFYLENTSLSVSQIAETLNYSTPESFSVVFKKYYQKTPGAVRREAHAKKNLP